MRAGIALAIAAFVAGTSAAPTPDSANTFSALKKNIKNIVYLMLENRSFDNIAGYWNFRDDIDNLNNIQYCNEYTHPNYTIYNEPIMICAGPYEQEIPLKDPDHNFAGVSYEIYRKWNPTSTDTPNMGGFIERQAEKYSETPGDASFVIQALTQEMTGTLSYLAQNYGFFDAYHAEHPGPTNPNRQFATSGSTCGMVDNTYQSAGFFSNVTGVDCAMSIFESLDNAGISWKNYYETDIIDAWMYKYVQENSMNKLQHASEFFNDLANGTLPRFSYINPECCSVDSMHPLSSPAGGEMLIKHIYDALRASPYWENTLLIINFDEHGGFADHVNPPTGVPAPQDGMKFSGVSDGHNVTFDFTRLGVRVPAFIISPYVPANTLIHSQGTKYFDNSAYTHTSFLHFIQQLWGLKGLNNRVQWAQTFESVLTTKARTDCPETLPAPIWYGGAGQTEPTPFTKLNMPYSYYAGN